MPQLRHRPGELIQNRYEVRKTLGSGAYGTVYGCRDTELNLALAVKELHVLDDWPGANGEGSGERAAALVQFREEATHLSKLRHPHIVSGHYEPHKGQWRICPVCGLHQDGEVCPEHGAALLPVTSRHYLVMEYIGGADLLEAATAAGDRLPVDDVLRYGREIAGALAHIHTRGYVHRDIKPENIRLRAQAGSTGGEAVLLDFGIATRGESAPGDRYGTRVQRHTTGGGTVGYAPESPLERQNPDARSDIHAFGMTLYHLLSGQDPTDPLQAREMRRHGPADFEPEIPVELDELLTSCIDRDPGRRPQHGGELLAALEAIENGTYGADEAEDASDLLEPPAHPAAHPPAWSPPPVFAAAAAAAVPASPFLFRSGAYARDVAELAPLLDQYPGEASRHLFAGEFEDWLFSIGEDELAHEARSIRSRFRARPAHGLEVFAQATGELEPPAIGVWPETLRFGTLAQGGQRTQELRIENDGRGQLYGRISATLPAVYSPGEWDGNHARVAITFDAGRLRPGRYAGDIVLDSLAGPVTVPFDARVAGAPWLPAFLSVVLYGAGGLAAGGLLRMVPFSWTAHHPGWGWITASTRLHWYPAAPLFGLTLGALWLVSSVVECAVRRSLSLFLLAAPVGVLLTLGCGVMGLQLLTNGDALLQPYTHGVSGNFAAGGWLIAGAGLGALFGTLRRPLDTFSYRILSQIAGWLAVVCLIGAALSGAGAIGR